MLTLEKHGIKITAYDYLAGGIGSVQHNGKEYIDNVHGESDHGRQLQTALQYRDADGAQGEDYNPTECGAGGTKIPGQSKSILLGAGTRTGRLQSTCRAALWLPYKGKEVSDTIIRKSVGIEPWGLDYRVTVDPTGEDETNPTFYNAEALTAYMPWDFQDAGFITPTSIINAPDNENVNKNHPCYMATRDGQHAMAVVLEDAHRYVVIRFPDQKVVKWSALHVDNTPDPLYRYNLKVFIGTKQEVINGVRGNVVAPPSDTFCPDKYIEYYKDIAKDPYYSKNPKEHYDKFGKAEGRNPCPDVAAPPPNGVVFCPEKYLERYPGVAANPTFRDNPRLHYDQFGQYEGRDPCPDVDIITPPDSTFCPDKYLAKNPGVAAHPHFKDHPEEHYEQHGKFEGRDPCPDIDTGNRIAKKVIPLSFTGRFAIGDLTGKGNADFVVSARNKLAAYDIDGNQLWRKDGVSLNWDLYPVGSGYNDLSHPYWNWSSYGWIETINDKQYFFHIAKDWRTLVVRDGATGDVVTQYNLGAGKWQYVLVGRRSDGGKRIFIAKQPGTLHVKALRFDGGTLTQEWERNQGIINAAYAPPQVADITGDGEDDIVHSTLALQGNGALIWKKDLRDHSRAGIHTLQIRKYDPNVSGLQCSYSIYNPRASDKSSIITIDKNGKETHNKHSAKHPHQHTAGKYPDMKVLARNNDGKNHWLVNKSGGTEGFYREDPSSLDNRWGREWGHEPTELVYNIDWNGVGQDEVLFVERHINFNTVGMAAVWSRAERKFLTPAFHGGKDVPRKDPDPNLNYLNENTWYGWQHRKDSVKDGPYEGSAHVCDVMGIGTEQVLMMAPNKLMIYYNPNKTTSSKWASRSYRTQKKLWCQVYNPR